MAGDHRSRRRKPQGGKTKRSPGEARGWPVKRALSSGGVVIRRGEDGFEVAMTRRLTINRRSAWGLPKGGLEEGETAAEAALREVREETGLDAEIVEELPDVTYWFSWAPERTRYKKTVHFFLMRMTGGDPTDHDDETEEVRFVPVDRAARLASYSSEKKVLRRAAEIVSTW